MNKLEQVLYTHERDLYFHDYKSVVWLYKQLGFSCEDASCYAENWQRALEGPREAYTCTECGNRNRSHTTPHSIEGVFIFGEQVCFNCAFYLKYIRLPHPKRIIYNGSHYVAYPGINWDKRYAGFGGITFRFILTDGSELLSNNIWHQGTIPERFRDRLPDTAISREEVRR